MSRLKNIIKLFIPPIFIKILHCKKQKKNVYFSTIDNVACSRNCLYILGNGPSLAETIDGVKDDLKNNDCIVVNNFCKTALFEEIKPKFYVIADPTNLGQIDNLSDALKEETVTISDKLKTVDWDINLIVPDFAKSGDLINTVSINSHVKIFYYNTFNMPKYNDMIADWAENRVAPPAQTVLNTCLYLGIFWKYKEINILGMDMSWHEDLELDQKTNELFIVDKHFYGTKKRFATLDINGIKPAKVHEYLMCSVNALKSFWDLRDFADYNNVKIYNLSHHSWVDAFERKCINKKQ